MDLEEKKEKLLNYYKNSKYATQKEVIEAFKRVPRENFIHPHQRNQAYDDHPLPIGHGQTISAPHMAFIMCELLELKESDIVLEIGGGSGYHAAICAEIIAPPKSQNPGHVYTIERIPELVEFARNNLAKSGYSDVVTVILIIQWILYILKLYIISVSVNLPVTPLHTGRSKPAVLLSALSQHNGN